MVSQHCRSDTAAFWHIYGQGTSNHTSIVLDQWQVISSSGLLEKLDKVYYMTVGASENLVKPWHEKLHHLGHSESGHEILTLKSLYTYCQNNLDSKVLYFHNKGSFNPSPKNTLFRQALDCYNLNPQCLRALDKYDTCGLRLTPIPVMHYSGNYFWATCKYVSKLLDPLSMEQNATLRNGTLAIAAGKEPWCLGAGRYFAEMWIASLPGIEAADCMSATKRAHYLYSHRIQQPFIEPRCPNTRAGFNMSGSGKASYGEACGPLKVLGRYNPLAFQIWSESKYDNVCSNIPAVVRRSFLWYGKPPVTYLKIMKHNFGPKRWKKYQKYDIYLDGDDNREWYDYLLGSR